MVTLISVGMFVFAFRVIKHKNQYASALTQTIQQKIIEEENILESKNIIAETKQKHDTLKSFIVDQDKIDEFATYIEAQGDAVGIAVNIRNVEISPMNPNILSLTFDGIGNFEDVTRLLWIIENSPYKISVHNVSMASSVTSKWQVSVKIEVISSQFK